MKRKNILKFLSIIIILLSFACEGELEDCVTTICDGPQGTDCREEPNYGSDCFPAANDGLLELD